MLSPALHHLTESARALGRVAGLSVTQCNVSLLVFLALTAAAIAIVVGCHRRS